MWLCKPCEFENDDLTVHCKVCNDESPLSHYQRGAVAIKRGIFLDWGYMTPQEELYAKFYNKGKLLVADMDMTQLREHREELARVAFEAKAMLASTDDELRERKAKSTSKTKEWILTPTDVDQNTSDAINAVKVRKDRMSKIDKMRTQLLNAGIDEETVKEMIGNLERKATEKNLKTVTFNKQVTETSAVQVEVKKPEGNGEVKPFDPSTLVFSKKDDKKES
jgi:hypothetical protein